VTPDMILWLVLITFGFRKGLQISSPAERLRASERELGCTKLLLSIPDDELY
jgi:hypothetical protein